MSWLSGYDSEVVGFESTPTSTNPKASTSSQTVEFAEIGVASQTHNSKDFGCMTQSEIGADNVPVEYTPPGLNEFLQKVVPDVMEQLDQNDKEFSNNSSDSDEEDPVITKLMQEISLKDRTGSGDHDSSILGITWSSGGNTLAVSIGQMVHDTWCQSSGLIKVFTMKRRPETFISLFDISEKYCVTVLKYHPILAALLAYGTTSGEVVLCNLVNESLDEGTQLTSPSGCHGARRVSYLHWADLPLANLFLVMQIQNKKKRRGAGDQVLISAGSNGSINVWQVNSHQKVFENIICYNINGSRKSGAPDITCFDFIKSYPLRPSDEKIADDIFVVGTRTGKLFLCKVKGAQEDPVYDELEGHGTCVLDVAFNFERPGVFVSMSMDSELRVYNIAQGGPLKIINIDSPVTCMSWLVPPCVVVGLANGDHLLKVYNVDSSGTLPVVSLDGRGDVTCVAASQIGSRIAAGDKNGIVRIWEVPTQRLKRGALDTWI